MECEGIGPERAEAIAEWFADDDNAGSSRSCGRSACASRRVGGAAGRGAADGQPVRDRRHARGMSREEAKAALEALGAKVSDNVSEDRRVFVGESPGSKVAKAQKAGVPLLGEAELQEL